MEVGRDVKHGPLDDHVPTEPGAFCRFDDDF